MTSQGRSAEVEGVTPFAGLPDRPTCPRCDSFLRDGHTDDAVGLCDPCRRLVDSCAPFAGGAEREQAQEGVNLLELVAGIMLTHDALHPGELLYLREALAVYGVEVDHVKIWQTVGKLERRHGLVLRGKPREPGYAVEDWTWETTRVRNSMRDG